MKRRELLNILFFSVPIFYVGNKLFSSETKRYETNQKSIEIFKNLMAQYSNNSKKNYSSINRFIIDFSREFLGYPYKAGTLEGEGEEICRFDLTGFDCVTLVESSLCLSRILMKGLNTIEDFANELIFTRYRNGILEDYTSRLHYTADWAYDNIQKGVVEDLTKELGGVKLPLKVNFMSSNPNLYPPLKENKAFIDKIKIIEADINSRNYYYIPKDKVKEIEPFLRTADIICIATNKKGLDYSHLGLAYIEEIRNTKKARFLHSSSKQKKVIIDKTISEYLNESSSSIGITILRPMEV
ncbi:MAG: DUF1460 domain-containing protein [Candidatus Kapabacteria bacterium]|nr:DUF1460 domain-containing protein [Candidatus Kapabacteria bacterium]